MFLSFSAVLGVVKYLDNYSETYATCAQKWQTEANRANLHTSTREAFLEKLNQDIMSLNGEPCPKLRGAHKKSLETLVADRPASGLRGLTTPN